MVKGIDSGLFLGVCRGFGDWGICFGFVFTGVIVDG
jgi:hypothetical protein